MLNVGEEGTQSGHIISSGLKSQVTFIQFQRATYNRQAEDLYCVGGFLMGTKASLNFAPFKTVRASAWSLPLYRLGILLSFVLSYIYFLGPQDWDKCPHSPFSQVTVLTHSILSCLPSPPFL